MREEPRISLTEFVDVVSSSGTSKAAKIRRMKRVDYSVAGDFYKPIREHLVNIHRQNLPKVSIQTIYRRIDDQKKIGSSDFLYSETGISLCNKGLNVL